LNLLKRLLVGLYSKLRRYFLIKVPLLFGANENPLFYRGF